MNKIALIILFVFVVLSNLLSCSSDPAKVTISPKSFDFEIVRYGESKLSDFTITNKFKDTITITLIEFSGENADQFTLASGGTPGTTIDGNEGTHTISVEFTPKGDQAFTIMIVNYNDVDDKPKTIEIKLKGNCESAPIFTSSIGSPSKYDYGIVNISNYVDYTITITNDGIADLSITDVQINGTDFIILSGWNNTDISIVPSNTHDFVVRFEPTKAGSLNDKIEISHNATNVTSPFDIELTGEGCDIVLTTNIAGTPPTIDFGEIFQGTTTSSKSFTISNIGVGDLHISNMQILSNDFTIVSGWSGSPLLISGGSSKDFDMIFNAKTTGTKNVKLRIEHNAKNVASPYEIVLIGEANDNYKSETFIKGMTPINGGTSVILSDDDYKTVPIGFTFNFYGNDYNQIYICSNGFIGFGPSTSNYTIGENSYPLPNSGTSNNCIYLFKTDLNPALSGTISYKVEGSGTDRVLIVEFNQIPNALNHGNFIGQIRLYETTNIIELHYSTSMSWATIHWSNNIIGVENEVGTKGIDYDGIKTNPVSTIPTDNIRYK